MQTAIRVSGNLSPNSTLLGQDNSVVWGPDAVVVVDELESDEQGFVLPEGGARSQSDSIDCQLAVHDVVVPSCLPCVMTDDSV